MKIDKYSVTIPQGIEDTTGYVALRHGTKYQIQLRNDNSVPCAVKVEIDGKDQGVWKLDAYRTATLERPVHDNGHFTFYKLDSVEGQTIGLSKDSDLGLIKVTFTPAKKQVDTPRSYNPSRGGGQSFESCSTKEVTRSYSAGGTGLSGKSSQEYGSADAFDLDYLQEVVINLRLVYDETGADRPRPLTPRSNPVPPPLV